MTAIPGETDFFAIVCFERYHFEPLVDGWGMEMKQPGLVGVGLGQGTGALTPLLNEHWKR